MYCVYMIWQKHLLNRKTFNVVYIIEEVRWIFLGKDDEIVANTKQRVLDEIKQIVYFGLAKKGSSSPTSPKICKSSPTIFHNLFLWFYLVLFKSSKLLKIFAWKVLFQYILHPDTLRIWKCCDCLCRLRKV